MSPTLSLILSFRIDYCFFLILLHLSLLAEEISELLVGDLLGAGVVPEVRSVVRVGVLQGSEASLDRVTQSTGVTTRAGVHVINSSQSQHLLQNGRSDDSSSTRSRDQAHAHRSALASDLHRHGVHGSGVVTPVSTADGDDRHLGNQNGSLDGSGDFLSALRTKTHMTVAITNGDESLEDVFMEVLESHEK